MGEAGLLTSVRVLELASGDGTAAGVGRILADLGADVLRIEAHGGAAHSALPTIAGVGIGFVLDNANKRCTSFDPADASQRARLLGLAAAADILIDSGNPGGAAVFGASAAELADRFAHLVVLSVTDFGLSGPRASWRGNDAVFYALSSALSRTGPTTGTPVLPPVGVGSWTAAVQAAWAVLAAYYDRTRSGRGDFIDFSRFEAVVQALDPPYGSEGQAAVGLKPPAALWRGRPRNQQIYPIFRCRDGHVRICLLSPRQWRGMRTWLGEPQRFAGPEFDTIAARYAASADLNEAIAALFAPQSMDELVSQGRELGVPIAAVRTPAEALCASHFHDTGALAEAPLIPGAAVTIPVGPITVDGRRLGFRSPATHVVPEDAGWTGPVAALTAHALPPMRPFDGIRILDLGVIVAGGELGRLFADLGAEVIKIESAAYPDGLRQAPAGMPLSRSWALTHRNEYSLGLDLRDPAGADLFARLVATADAVFANFKPGTLAALGFPVERLRQINPDLVVAESSAYGDRGPWSAQMGYGPLVRASTGITRLWTSPDAPPGEFFDATTIFPDHVVGRLTAVAALAALVRRDREGGGAHVHLSQAEVAINALADRYVVESARSAGLPVAEDDTVHAVCPCAGDDEWCVISVPGDTKASEHAVLASLLGGTELPRERSALTAALGAWTASRDKQEVAAILQGHGVAAAPMYRAADLSADPQLVHRHLFGELVHPLLERPIPAETGPAPYRRIPRAALRPAPMPGQHTREICTRVLGLAPERIDALLATGVLFDYQQEG